MINLNPCKISNNMFNFSLMVTKKIPLYPEINEIKNKKNYNIGDLLKKLRKFLKNKYNIGINDIITALGIKTPQGYYRYERNEVSLSLNQLKRLSDSFNVPIGYFFGEYELTEDGRFIRVGGDEPYLDDFVLVNLAEARPSAGGGSWEFEYVQEEGEGRKFAFRKDWISRVATSPKNLILFYVKGDSMYPTLKDGDIILVDKGKNKIEDIQPNKIYVIRVGNDVSVKRLIPIPPNKIRVISDNKQIYPPFDIENPEAENFQILGKVIWAGVNLE